MAEKYECTIKTTDEKFFLKTLMLAIEMGAEVNITSNMVTPTDLMHGYETYKFPLSVCNTNFLNAICRIKE